MLTFSLFRFVKFQNVSELTLFVESNIGEEPTSVIQRLRLIGQTQAATNMGDFKRVRLHVNSLLRYSLATTITGGWREGRGARLKENSGPISFRLASLTRVH